MSEPEHLVLAHTASSPTEAELVRALLEAAGLFAVTPNHNTPLPALDLTPFDGDYRAMGCEVLVASKDIDRALEVIQEARAQGRIEDDSSQEDEGDAGEEGEPEEP